MQTWEVDEDHRLTTDNADLKRTYIASLGTWGTIGKARKEANISLHKLLSLREDPDFVALEELAMEEFKGSLIEAAVEQGRDGILEDVIYRGERQYEKDASGKLIPLRVRKYTPTILVKLIDHFFPNKSDGDDDNKPVRLNLNVVRIKDGDKQAEL